MVNIQIGRQQQLIKMAAAAIDNYLAKTDKVSKEERSELAKFAQQYASSNEHKKFINLIYSSLKKHLNKQNFMPTCKRFLILLDQILQISQKKPAFAQYSTAVSVMLVQCYIYVFSLIFQYQVHEAALDWKVYRMLWAKIISDHTFDALRSEISAKYRNFDLNKGFTSDSIERIKKRYSRKGFTEAEVKRYLQANKPDPRLQFQTPQTHSKPTQERQSIPKEYTSSPRRIPPPQSFYEDIDKRNRVEANNFAIRHKDYSEARSSSSVERPLYKKNQQPMPNMGMGQYYISNPPIRHAFQHFPPPQPNFARNPYGSNDPRFQYIEKSMPVMAQKPFIPPPPPPPSVNAYIPHVSPYSSPERFSREPLLKSKSDSTHISEGKSASNYKKLLAQLYANLYDCKQCGQFFQSKNNLKVHQEEHVLSAQNEILNREFNKASDNPASFGPTEEKFQRLLSIEDWVLRSKEDKQQVQQQIRIANDINKYNFACYFCQEELKVAWCEPLEDWTLKDAVKVKDEEGNIQFAHLSCYNQFVPRITGVETLVKVT